MSHEAPIPSSMGVQSDELFCTRHAKQFVELHDQVKTSIGLLDSLEGFLSTFQTDLSAVAGQISDLQDRSKDIDSRLKSRKKIERPLSSLLTDLCISPSLAKTVLDTDVGEPWLSVIPDFERRLKTLNVRKRVKAARDLSEVAEGLRIVAATKIRAFFLLLIQPIRTSMSTNMQVLQTSVLIKYRPLYEFLQSQAQDVAREIQRAYVAAARVYYETGFRRYIRILGWVKARSVEKSESLGNTDQKTDYSADDTRLANAKIEGPAAIQAYIAEDKNYKEPPEAVFRSMLLVLLDNATAEYAFIAAFFLESPAYSDESTLEPPPSAFSQAQSMTVINDRMPSFGASVVSSPPIPRRSSLAHSASNELSSGIQDVRSLSKEQQTALSNMWKQIMDPALTHCETLANSVLEPIPPVITLLVMIRMLENTLSEVQLRGCGPLESWLFGLRMRFWPVFQKLMSEHVTSLQKLAESTTSGYFRRSTTSDAVIQAIANRYVTMFSSFVMLTETEDETMIFSNLNRLRQELTILIQNQSKSTADPLKSATFQSSMFDMILQSMNKRQHSITHPKSQAELAYWREREEESRRRLTSTARQAR